MDFVSDFILEEESEEEEEEEIDRHEGGDNEACADYDDYDNGGLECEIMDFDDEFEEHSNQTAKKKKPKGTSMNTVNLPLERLKELSDLTLSDKLLYECSNRGFCGAYLSNIDEPEHIEGSNMKIWNCRFCGVQTKVKEWPDFTPREGTPGNDILFVKDPESPPDMEVDTGDNTVIFVLDTSGSMAQTDQKRSMVPMFGPMAGGMGTMMGMPGMMGQIMGQMMGMPGPPGGQKTEADKTRLDAMKEGIKNMLMHLKNTAPKTKVGFISFNCQVLLWGDGSSKPMCIPENVLNDYSMLLTIGQKQKPLGPVADGCDNMINALQGLREEGRTALGPALVIAMAMAGKSQTSKVILCTDGYANVGVGRLEDSSRNIKNFFKDVSAYCKTQGVSVSLVSLDDCGVAKDLGEVPVETGGTVCKINLQDTQLPIIDELNKKTMATDAFVKFVVHKHMLIEDPNSEEPEQRSNMRHLVGNINDQMKRIFRFGFRRDEQTLQDRKDIIEKKGQIAEKPKQTPTKEDTVTQLLAITDSKEKTADEKCLAIMDGKGLTDDVKTLADSDGEGQAKNIESAHFRDDKLDEEIRNLSKDNHDAATKKDDGYDSDGKDSDCGQDIQKIKEGDPDHPDVLAAAEKKAEEAEAQVETITEEFPFQVQISFTDLNGVEATRIWTNIKPVTSSKQVAQDASNTKIRVENLIQSSAQKFLDISQGKIQDVSIAQEAKNITAEITELIAQIQDPGQMNMLNEYLTDIVNKIASLRYINDEIGAKLRNMQTGCTVDKNGSAVATSA